MFLMRDKTMFVVGYEEDGQVVPICDQLLTSEADAMHICERKGRFSDHDLKVYEVVNLEMIEKPLWVGGTRENTTCSKDY